MHHLSILAAEKSSGGAAILQLGIFLLIPLAMYFLLIRPQKRRQRESAALQSAIEIGDEVMTTSGLYGFVTGFEDDRAWLEIDDNVQIRIARAAIQRKVDTSKGEPGSTPSDNKPLAEGSSRSTAIADADGDSSSDPA